MRSLSLVSSLNCLSTNAMTDCLLGFSWTRSWPKLVASKPVNSRRRDSFFITETCKPKSTFSSNYHKIGHSSLHININSSDQIVLAQAVLKQGHSCEIFSHGTLRVSPRGEPLPIHYCLVWAIPLESSLNRSSGRFCKPK